MFRIAAHLAQRPPMGWNSWNTFGCDIDEGKIRGVADMATAVRDLPVRVPRIPLIVRE